MKHILQPLKSASKTRSTNEDALHRILTGFGHRQNIEGLRSAMISVREDESNRSINHPDVFSPDEIKLIEKTRQYLIAKFLGGCGFVRNTNGAEGDVGIAYQVSYTRSEIPKTKDVKDVSSDMIIRGCPQAISFHVQVALPNGFNTSWRVSSITKLSDEEGFVEYKSFMV
jgi:hypothetical protein